MIIDAPRTDLVYFPLSFSRNPLLVTVDAANPATYPARTGLRYELELFVQEHYNASTFVSYNTMNGSERPPVQVGPVLQYPGAQFDVRYLLDDLLIRSKPTFGQQTITVCDCLTRAYYTKTRRSNNGTPIDQQTQNSAYAIKAGLAERDFGVHRDRFFKDNPGKFLTWCPDNKSVRPDQPEYLYFLANFSPLPTTLKLRIRVRKEAADPVVFTATSAMNLSAFTVYSVPVGPVMLGANLTADAVAYDAWLSDQNDDRVSEIRSYQIDRRYAAQVRYVLFNNSLGGFDTLALTGRGSDVLKVNQTIADRYDDYQLNASYAERIVNDSQGERELTVASGPLSAERLEYLSELLLAEEVYLVTDRAHIPLLRVTDGLTVRQDDEGLIGRMLTYRYANRERNYSRLPVAEPAPSRPTAWRPFATACELTATGLRTGRRMVTLLEQYYTDDQTAVKPATVKPNTPGTTGYVGPVVASSCASTPYLSALISRQGTFKRSTGCASGQEGTTALIVIPASTYGSEISQADADAKAERAWSLLNTQAYADQYGVCEDSSLYSWTVPAGHWHYRSNRPASTAVYTQSDPQQGNAWFIQSSASPYRFGVGTNDLDFPTGNAFILVVYGTPGAAFTAQLYADGVLYNTASGIINSDGFEQTNLFAGLAGGLATTGQKLYIKLTV